MSNFINEAVIGRSTFGIGSQVVDDSQNVNITAVTVDCSDYLTEHDCTEAGCFWWIDGTCHSKAEGEEDEIPLALIIGVAIAAVAGIVIVLMARR